MNSVIYLVDQIPCKSQSLRIPYKNPTKSPRNCSLLIGFAGMDWNAWPLAPARWPISLLWATKSERNVQ